MKKEYKEIRQINADSLRRLCISKRWYTGGDNAAYNHLLSKGTTFHTVRRKQKAGKHNMRCSFPLFFCPRIYILYFFAFEMHTPNL